MDDEAPILHSLRRLFLDEPWQILSATSGEEGLRVAVAHDIEVVLADFRMPGMDGVEFLRRVRMVRPDCLRVVLSGYADVNLIVTGLNEGLIHRFLSKPWNDDELRHHVRGLLDEQRQRLENRRLHSEVAALTARLGQRADAAAISSPERDRTIEFARVALESVPIPLVCVNGRGDILMANADARRLLRTSRTDALDRALSAAVDGARRSRTGYHVEPFGTHEAAGVVVATAGTDALLLLPPKSDETRGKPADTAGTATETPP
ncbi:MAG: response regulator [Planctomycetota bacterium]